MTGVFLTFEGGEGAGKSTNLRMLPDALRGVGKTVVATREPGGSEGAEEIRRLLVESAVDRWDCVSEALLHSPALDRTNVAINSTSNCANYCNCMTRVLIACRHAVCASVASNDAACSMCNSQ